MRHAVARYAEEVLPGGAVPEVTDAAMMRLTAYRWPGNVRQLLSTVQNMTVMAIGDAAEGAAVRLDSKHIPDEVRADEDASDGDAPAPDTPLGEPGSLAGASIQQLEKRAIRDTLKLTGGNREQTAKLLGIGERTLYRKLREYGLR
ncbi:MAG: helix-turn-helix domain-containing protein [Planctomycetota bacterium]